MPFRNYFFICCINFVAILILGVIFWFGIKYHQQNSKDLDLIVDEKIQKIVLSTLLKVREDVGVLNTSSESVKKNDEKEESLVFDGANVRTYGYQFWIDGESFQLGDIVFPYGLAIEVGRNVVIFDDLRGKTVVLGRKVKTLEEKDEKEKKMLDKEENV